MMTTQLPRDADGRLLSYAWPGGYSVLYLMGDGDTLCADCANGENGSDASAGAEDAGWWIDAGFVHCKAKIKENNSILTSRSVCISLNLHKWEQRKRHTEK